jgi:catechol-2,3-dioxygenase
MFDHITLRVADLAVAGSAFTAVLDELEIEQTTGTPSLSVWGNFVLTQTDEEHPIARRVHIAFIAPTPAHVDRFGQAGIDAGFADDGPAGPRPDYADDYYAAFLKDPAGNGFEAVHRDGERPRGNIDHVASASTTSRRQLRFTRRSAMPPASRSGAKHLTAPHSRSVHQAGLST